MKEKRKRGASKKILKEPKEDFSFGKIVKVIEKRTKKEYIGKILESYDNAILIIQLENGYNIGIKKEDIERMEILKNSEKKEIKKEELKQNENLPGISIILTGGTIASKADYKSGGVKPIENISEILEVAPDINKICKINKIEKPFLELSENINSNHWKILAEKINLLLKNKENKGVIILHGTDTMSYTASAIAFMLGRLDKPVVFAYAQKSIDRGSSDAKLNLQCAVQTALSKINEVVLVGHESSNDDFCQIIRAVKSRKMHSTRRDAFKSINESIIARAYPDKVEIINQKIQNKKTLNEPNYPKICFDNKVAILKFYPNSDPKIIDYYIENKYKGIILEGTGLGHISLGEKSWETQIKKAIQNEIIVCMTTQCIFGRVNPFVYETGRKINELGVLYLDDMLTETAFTKLSWILGFERNKEKVKELMKENLINEYNPKISEKDFL